MVTSRDPASFGIALGAPVTSDELARRYGGTLDEGARGRRIECIASSNAPADAASLVPVLRVSAIAAAAQAWGLVLVSDELAARVPMGSRWVHTHASWALASLLGEGPSDASFEDERQRAHIEEGADIAPTARVGAFAVIRRGAVVGASSTIGAHAVVDRGAIVGAGCAIEPHAVVYGAVELGDRVRVGAGAVIGRPGFGWAHAPTGGVVRVPQRGGVVIEDDVEIGPLATIDAGTLAPTRIGRGAKLDAHVHVAHNVVIGPGALVAAQSGFAGSAVIGAGVLVGGQVGVADHVQVGDGARLAAKAGVIGNVPAGEVYAGYPAMPRLRWLRGVAGAVGLGRSVSKR